MKNVKVKKLKAKKSKVKKCKRKKNRKGKNKIMCIIIEKCMIFKKNLVIHKMNRNFNILEMHELNGELITPSL